MSFARITQNAIGRERMLLWLAGAFLLINAAILTIAARSLEPLVVFVAWTLGAYVGHRLLERDMPQRDPFLFPIAMLLTGWGLLMIERLAPNFTWRQVVWLYLSLAAMLAVSRLPIHLRWLRRYRYTWLSGGLLLLLVTIVLGVNPSGAGPRLWLGAAGLYFQPSELLKLVLVIFLASYLADYHDELRDDGEGPRRWPPLRALGPLLLMWGISMVVVIWQQDLGTAALFFIAFVIMLYIASGRVSYVLTGVFLLLVALIVAYRFVDVVRLRTDIWLNPWPEADGRAFQIVQSLLSFASGGVFGQGIGLGSPGYVPVIHSDFIFAAVGEEWGLLGVLGVIVCFAVLIIRGLQLAAMWANSVFRMLLAAGLSVLLAVQSLLIMGGVLKTIPMTGVTLPFMSYGGSSLLINYALIGLFLMLSSTPTASINVEDGAAR
jgi:cell division protein FtsW (lipid II flippase)